MQGLGLTAQALLHALVIGVSLEALFLMFAHDARRVANYTRHIGEVEGGRGCQGAFQDRADLLAALGGVR